MYMQQIWKVRDVLSKERYSFLHVHMDLMLMFHTLNSRNQICQLYLNKAGESRGGDDQRGRVGMLVPHLALLSGSSTLGF